MGSERFVGDVVAGFATALEPLGEATSSPADLAALLSGLGFSLDPAAPSGPIEAAFGQLPQHLTELATATQALAALPQDADLLETGPAIARVATAIAAATNDVRGLAATPPAGLPPPLDDAAFWAALAGDLAELLLYEYLEEHQPTLFGFLRFLGIAVLEERAAAGARDAFVRHTIRWDRLVQAASDPVQLFRDVYGWGGAFDHARFFANVADLAAGLGSPVATVDADAALLDAYYDPSAPAREGLAELRLPVHWAIGQAGDATAFSQVALATLPIPAAGDRMGAPVGFVLVPRAEGVAAGRFVITDWLEGELAGGVESTGAVRLEVRPSGAGVAVSPTLGASIAAAAKLTARPPQPWILFGAPASTRLELGGVHASVGARGAVPDLEALIEVGADSAALVLDFGEGDGFLQRIFGTDPQRFELGAALTWSSRSGFRFNAQGRLEATIPVHQTILGIVDVESIFVAAHSVTAPPQRVELVVAATGAVRLGPLVATVKRVGLRLEARPVSAPAPPGNLGDLDLGLGFKSPEGAGLAISAGPVEGGGALDYDDANKQYAGLAYLSFSGISLTAVGLLTTRMPDGSDGFSLLIIISGEFPPIQLGYGFTLNGAGGLLGINRTVVVDVLREGVRTQALNGILFPQDPIRNAPQIVSQLSAIFPPAEGRYIFGPMVKLGWGTPTILAVELGVALELPSPVRLLIMGRLTLTLPEESVALVLLKMDVLGIVEFDRGEASVDATIYDSHVAVFAVTGDMAMRARWSTDPTFALSVGGFNPRFSPPPGFPALNRVAIALASGDNPRLRLEAYLALTSNTFQVGARLDAYAALDLGWIGRFSVEAYLGFDALFHFDPFSFIVEIAGGAALKRNGKDLLSVTVELTLTGPQPMHAWGEASFRFLGRHSIELDVTVGPDAPPQELPAVDPTGALVAALAERGNWSAQLPEGGSMLVALRDRDAGTDVLAHPLGRVTVRQRVVPLNVELTHYGNARLSGDRRFVVAVTIGGVAPTPAPQPLRDLFAPAQFFELTDDEKLDRPSFEPLDAGLSFGSAAMTHGSAVPRDVVYEDSVIDVGRGTTRRLGPHRIGADVMAGLMRSGGAAQRSGASRFAGPPLGIEVTPARYGVAATGDLAAVGTAGSYTEAVAAHRHAGARPGTTQVVREYERA